MHGPVVAVIHLTVWAFTMGKTSGPRTMTISTEHNNDYGVRRGKVVNIYHVRCIVRVRA